MRTQVGLEGSGDWWSVTWHCPGDALCGYQRTFVTEAEAKAFMTRLRTEGCPGKWWFHDETQYQHRNQNRDAS